MPLPEIPPHLRGVTRVVGVSTGAASYQPGSNADKSLVLETWAPAHVWPWGNLCAGASAPLTLAPDDTGQHRAPADVMVNGRMESWPFGKSPVLAPGDVLANPGGEVCFRVPTPLTPCWPSAYAADEPREEFLARLDSAVAGTGWSMAKPDARHLLGAARAWRIGALRGRWERGFLVEARLAPAATLRTSMAWHLWQLLASPAGFALERFSGTPSDADDAAAVVDVVRAFPAARLKDVVLEVAQPLPALEDPHVRQVPLPWLTLDGELPADVRLDGGSRRPRLMWRQLGPPVSVNGHTFDDRCVWNEPLWLELREGDVVNVASTRNTVSATGR